MSPRGATSAFWGVLLLLLVGTAALPATGLVYDLNYSSQTGTVRGLSVSLQSGGAGTGSSTVSSIAANAATVTMTAGLVFYESAAPATSCAAPSANTALTVPAPSSGSLSRGTSYCLWSTQFTSASTLYALTWITDFWLAANQAGSGLTVAMYVTNSAGTQQGGAIFSGATGTIATKNVITEIKNTFTGTAASVPANGYLKFTFTTPTGGGTPSSWTIYWGTGQATNFDTPSNYNYVLTVSNGATVTWSINLGVASSSLLTRLSNFTISFTTAPVNKQILVSGGSVTQSSGTTVTLGSSGTLNIAAGGTGSAMPTGSNTPSIVTVSLKVLSSSSSAYAQYTIVFNVY